MELFVYIYILYVNFSYIHASIRDNTCACSPFVFPLHLSSYEILMKGYEMSSFPLSRAHVFIAAEYLYKILRL